MTKVWLVCNILGSVWAYIGPIPDSSHSSGPTSMEHCQTIKSDHDMVADKAFKDPQKLAEMQRKWPNLKREDLVWSCVESDSKPVMGK